jgi:hypothetical protein
VAVPNSARGAPLIVQGTLSLAATSALDLTAGAPAAGNVHFFVWYGTLVDNPSAAYLGHGNGAFTPTVWKGANSITVTLS